MSDGGLLPNCPEGLRDRIDGGDALQQVREIVADTIRCPTPRFTMLRLNIREGRRDGHGLMRAGIAVARRFGAKL